ncbi:hypothetical protein ANOM_004525 [Aspergillus nomiae NRRL 13137]|uniref:Uncharacterized protein n=1 Tax=Aspergillus nomiae NRRL (strain ATCC 15546 / NRRL 13137 / CBS 260.88 / M93) TaxID=1509407 RepID=A0A0L1J393_ASPN3|nr:uncharacterized protein ANOM_004525 [Aspergillus nomiae NRRL 13137]KNG86276.1 hypothetical protein ANOM_004525 [Aspergillus nomiae NRRL 13137]
MAGPTMPVVLLRAFVLLFALLVPSIIASELNFPPNANHIFNAIHSSMRQWGSSLHHNGMSFFLATVPKGTQLYHGNSSPGPVNGTEWLAFEPEHAMVFARPHHGPPPGKGPYKRSQLPLKPEHMESGKDQDRDQDKPGYLHTYTAAKDLRLLYLDGMSAAKTENGTLDSQDRILLRDALEGRPGMLEDERAELICRMARDNYQGRLDGVIRMEAGFEIILCDFARDLDEIRVTQVKPDRKGPGPRGGKGKKGPLFGAMLWYKAIAARYNGIGSNRVILNYDHFVTAYVYGLDLFRSSGSNSHVLPRLHHLFADELGPIRSDLDHLIMNHDPSETSFNWQGVADMVVQRYAHELSYLVSGQLSTLQALHEEIENSLGPFIDYDDRNTSLEVHRCSMQFVPAGASSDGLASDAVRSVTHSICSAMIEAWKQTDYAAAVAQLQSLMDYLSWTTWKECKGCADNEICVIPIWPMGTVEDYEHPQCRDASRPSGEGRRYWGEPGGPGGPGGPEGPRQSSWLQRMLHYLQAMIR